MRKALSLLAVATLGASSAGAVDVRVQANNLPEDLASQILGVSLAVSQEQSAEATSQDMLAAARADYARIVAALYEHGYYGGAVSILVDGREAASIPAVDAPATINRIVIRVEQGKRFSFGRAQIDPIVSDTELPDGFRRGQPAELGVIKSAVSAGVDRWRERGYAKAELAGQEVTAIHPESRLDVGVALDPGPRFRFGRLQISGLERLDPRRAQKIAGLPTGEVYDPDTVKKVQERLRRTGVFSGVALTDAERANADGTLDINAQLVEQKPRRIGFGAELSTVEGLGVSGYWMHRNLLGGAESLRIDTEVSGIGGSSGGVDYKLGGTFTRPATPRADTDLYLKLGYEYLDEVNFKSRMTEAEVGFYRYATDRREYSYGVGLLSGKTEDDLGTRSYTLMTFPAMAKFDYRDNEVSATEGYFARLDVMPFASISGADNGVRGELDLRGYYTFGATLPVTLAARVQMGSVAGPELSEAPGDYLFYSGGGGTVRGHGYQSLGVDLGSGRRVGGKSFFGVSGEVRVAATDTIGVVGFYDAGYIGREAFPNGSDGEWHSGAGLGIRYATGIGPIRFDVGFPVTGEDVSDDSSDFQVYIGIGQAF